MEANSSWSRLPPSLAFFFVLFLTLPIVSFSFVPNPIDLIRLDTAFGIIHVLTYIIFPPIVALLIYRRSFWFTVVFALEMIGIGFLTLFSGNEDLHTVRYIMLGIMVAVSFFVIKRDVLFPFIATGSRFWRTSRRVNFNRPCQVEVEGDDESIRGLITDVSASGLGLTITNVDKVADRLRQDSNLIVSLRLGRKDLAI